MMSREEYCRLGYEITDALDAAYFAFLRLHELRDDLSVNDLLYNDGKQELTPGQKAFLSTLYDFYNLV